MNLFPALSVQLLGENLSLFPQADINFFNTNTLFGRVFDSGQATLPLVSNKKQFMAKRTTTKWLAVALHYGEPWEEFFIKAVKPFSDVTLQAGIAESFCFERSWEKGPHVRLWFKVNPSIFSKLLKPNLEEHFNQYFESRPSVIKSPYYPADYPSERRWMPNNSVQYPDLKIESTHFGGTKEVALFENHYMASSLLVLETMKEKANRWTYNEMISSAIKVHLSFAYAVGMDCTEAQQFMEFMKDKWFANYCQAEGEKAKTERTFANIYKLQRKDTIPYHLALWEMFKEYEYMDEDHMSNWIKMNADMNLDLDLALSEGNLKPMRTIQKSTTSKYPAKWDYFSQLINRTNNRFGLFNKNEGYMLYTISESMKMVSDSILMMREMRI